MRKNKRLLIFFIIFDVIVIALLAAYLFSFQETRSLDDASRAGLPGQFVPLEDGVTHYELVGPADGQLVVLVPGFSVPYYVWDPTVAGLTAAGFQVLRYDLFGRGYSDRPQVDYTLELFVRQLDQLTEVVTTNKPFHLVGLSMGGPIVAAYTNRNPEHILSLTLIAPETLPVTPKTIFPMNVPLLGEWVMKVYMVPFYLPQSQEADAFNPAVLPDWERRYRLQMQYKGFRRALLSTIRHLPEMNALEEYQQLSQSKIPILLIWGEEDQSVTYEAINEARLVLPHAEYLQLTQAGHLPHFEKAEVVNSTLEQFFNQ